jgi:hypothetical protein
MTRDYAINTLRDKVYLTDIKSVEWVDAFIALGMLKVEEPKTPEQKLAHALGNDVEWTYSEVMGAINREGLRLVEK